MHNNNIVLALDFDGVICDSIDECLISSYNAFHELEVDDLSKIPDDVKTYFYKFRHYVRPAKEYYIIHKAYQNNLKLLSLEAFKELNDKNNKETNLFEKRFFIMRNHLKKNEANWLSLHRIYDHVKDFFISFNKEFIIVTNKDKDSIERLSEYYGFKKYISEIYSKEISIQKDDLFNIIILNYSKDYDNNKFVYVDDNEWHLNQLQHLTIELYFAAWGYSGKQMEHSFNEINNLSEVCF